MTEQTTTRCDACGAKIETDPSLAIHPYYVITEEPVGDIYHWCHVCWDRPYRAEQDIAHLKVRLGGFVEETARLKHKLADVIRENDRIAELLIASRAESSAANRQLDALDN